MEQVGVELIAFPCNSLDYFIDYLRAQSDLPILSIVNETCKRVREKEAEEVLLLSTPITFNKELYNRYLRYKNIVRLENHEKILKIIICTMKGEYPKNEFIEMLEGECSMYKSIIIGCTDLSILVENYTNDKLIDSIKCLSAAIKRDCVKEKPKDDNNNLVLK
jgi:aspartate racemase